MATEMTVPYKMFLHEQSSAFCTEGGNSHKEIHDELLTVQRDNAPAHDSIVKRRRRLQCDRKSLDDERRGG